ncbi:hypothetical protein SGPA1_11829 [Streptomyces misionensis JCM 4497]
MAVPVGRAEGGQHGRLGTRRHRLRLRQPHPHRRPSAPGRLPAGADRARGPRTHPPGRRQPDRQRGQAQPAARPGHREGPPRAPAGLAGAGGARRGSGHPPFGVAPRLRAVQPGRRHPAARPRQRRRHRARPGDRPLGRGSARRPDRCGRIRAGLPDHRHPSGTELRFKLT